MRSTLQTVLYIYFSWVLLEGPVRKIAVLGDGSTLLIKEVLALIVFSVALPTALLGYQYPRKWIFGAGALITAGISVVVLQSILISSNLTPMILGSMEYIVPFMILSSCLIVMSVNVVIAYKLCYMVVIMVSIGNVLLIINMGLGLGLSLLQPIASVVSMHSSLAGYYYMESGLFDVPERLGFTNLVMLTLIPWLVRYHRNADLSELKRLYVPGLLSGIAFVSVVLSGRRVAILLAFIQVVFVIREIGGQRLLSKFASLLTITIIAALGAVIYSDALISTIFDRTFVDATRYGYWGATQPAVAYSYLDHPVQGHFGQISPGNSILGYRPAAVWHGGLESGFARHLYSLGIFGSMLIGIGLLFLVFGDWKRRWRNNGSVCLLLVYVIVWQIKSGNFLVWYPMTVLAITVSWQYQRPRPQNYHTEEGSVITL